jgi:hypothetical protein
MFMMRDSADSGDGLGSIIGSFFWHKIRLQLEAENYDGQDFTTIIEHQYRLPGVDTMAPYDPFSNI